MSKFTTDGDIVQGAGRWKKHLADLYSQISDAPSLYVYAIFSKT